MRELGGLVGRAVHGVHQRHQRVVGVVEDPSALLDVVAVEPYDERLVRLGPDALLILWSAPAARAVVTAELFVGVVALGGFAPRGQLRRSVALAIAVAIVALVVETGVTQVMIEAGWGGARRA